MDMHRAKTLTIAAACVSLFIAGCSKDETKIIPPAVKGPAQAPAPAPVAAAPAPAAPAPVAAATAAAAPPASAPAPTPVIASGEFNNDPLLRADLLEVKRVSGGSLTVRWRVVNTAGASQGLAAAQPKNIAYNYSYPQLYYTDPAENKKYQYLTDSQQRQLLQVYEGYYEPGQARGNWAKFPAPPATSKKITIHIPNFPPFEDIPVAD
jgi:hypothetical protein